MATRRIADRYVLGKRLGTGGSSRVYAALDERLGRRVAIKLLDSSAVASADPAGRERFLREGPTAASFNHRNAVTVFDAGEDGDDLYIVMELVDGPSLAERMAREGPLPVPEATNIARQVLAALAAAHAAGIVHRDVKPANVLLGADGEAKLTDFGIAKRFDELDESVTSTGTVVGTPRYLAPEQAMGAPATPATDIYGAGVVLFEMLTGKLPSPIPPDIRSLRPDVNEQLAATVDRALAPKPEQRFAAATEMIDALDDESALATQVLRVGPPVVRSGETQLMPVPTPTPPAPPVPRKKHTPKQPAAATPTPAPTPPPLPSKPMTSSRTPRQIATLIVVAVTAVIVFGLLTQRDTRTQLIASATENGSITTLAPAPTAPPVDEIIPGFPRTADIGVFLAQLEANPALVGSRGADVAAQLREVLDKHGKKQREAAEDLRDDMEEWVEEGGLHPAIADALRQLLVPYGGDD